MAASGEIYQVTYVGFLAGQNCENVIHYRALTGLITDAAIKTAAERFWFLSQSLQSVDYLYDHMVVKRMTPIPLDESIVTPSTVGGGSDGSHSISSTVAAVFTLRTGVAGKSHRGRIYFAGLSVTRVDAQLNRFNTAGGIIAATVAANLLSEFGPSGTNTALAMGIYSRVIGGIHPMTVAGWQQISGIDVQPILGNQRRRRIGVGV